MMAQTQSGPPLIDELHALVQRHEVVARCGKVVWRTLGQGKPLVLLHGGHGNWLHWARNLQALACHRRLWLPDMPGYGDSDPVSESTLGQLVQGLTDSLDSLLGHGATMDLAGFSFGGLVAASLAAQRGGIDRLILLGPAGHGGRRRPGADLLGWRAAAQAGDACALEQTMRHNLLAHMLHDEHSADALALQIHTEACLRTRFHSRPISRAGGLQSWLAQAGRPALLIWGEHDATADPPALAAQLQTSHPTSAAHVVPGAGHWVQFESPAAVNRLMGEWLKAP
ncbi:alpha/beta fold hydrolase [Delftia sp. PS-11]|uniref:alpha/beta fold hydrolase n=1 Tax=Delftia sp. PS-11 TaxID=2767222 RepID=UPI002457E85E|nr:alpha/beta fold hydrolase [Delftia sp. PS-11]KAJ8740597.1 alpha/beta fold hydrolase [Delftia sp. PS-11]